MKTEQKNTDSFIARGNFVWLDSPVRNRQRLKLGRICVAIRRWMWWVMMMAFALSQRGRIHLCTARNVWETMYIARPCRNIPLQLIASWRWITLQKVSRMDVVIGLVKAFASWRIWLWCYPLESVREATAKYSGFVLARRNAFACRGDCRALLSQAHPLFILRSFLIASKDLTDDMFEATANRRWIISTWV